MPSLEVEDVQITNSMALQTYPTLYRSGQLQYPQYNWKVDLPNEDVRIEEVNDVNFYEVIIETLRKLRQRYNIDFSKPENSMAAQRCLMSIDELVKYTELFVKLSRSLDLKVTMVGWEQAYVPNGVFCLLANSEVAQDSFEYVHLGTMYGHYYGSDGAFARNIGACNLTTRQVFNPFAGFKEEYRDFKQTVLQDQSKLAEVEASLEETLSEEILTSRNVRNSANQNEQKKLNKLIRDYQDRGKSVFTLFSHNFFDCGLYDTAPAFHDMCDWIDHTIDFFTEKDDLLLLKPHPGDVMGTTSAEAGRERLIDYVGNKTENIDNIKFLEPQEVSAATLYQLIDCGLVWRSSVGIEMALLGLPVIVSGNPRYKEYLDLPYPETTDRYEELLDNIPHEKFDDQLQTSASIYMYFEKEKRHVQFPYVEGMDYTYVNTKKVSWNRNQLDDFLKKGDPKLEELILSELSGLKEKTIG
jgi:hypothetical protein